METTTDDEFLTHAAVTRSMLGWGVVVGPLYLLVGLSQALTRDGFDLGSQQLSLLMLGDQGWVQQTNLLAAGVMALVAAGGMRRVLGAERAGRLVAALVAIFGLGMIGSGLFPPDPVNGFPPASEGGPVSGSGISHLAFGAVQFATLATACFVAAHVSDRSGHAIHRRVSTASGIVILTGFIGGAGLSQMTIGVVLLWIAVLAGFTWLALVSVVLWRRTPHPDPHRRAIR
jgi:hypothetical protein